MRTAATSRDTTLHVRKIRVRRVLLLLLSDRACSRSQTRSSAEVGGRKAEWVVLVFVGTHVDLAKKPGRLVAPSGTLSLKPNVTKRCSDCRRHGVYVYSRSLNLGYYQSNRGRRERNAAGGGPCKKLKHRLRHPRDRLPTCTTRAPALWEQLSTGQPRLQDKGCSAVLAATATRHLEYEDKDE